MNEQKIKLWVFSQQSLFRRGVRVSLADVADIDIAGEANLTDKISLTIDIMPPDAAIVDIDTAADSGLSLANRLKQISPSIAVIVLSSDVNDSQLFKAIKCQASAYLGKDIDSDELMSLRHKTVELSSAEKMMELFTTHPNMLKRIKKLSEYR